MKRVWLVVAAVAIGVAIVAFKEFAFAAMTGRPLALAIGVRPVVAIVVATPFLILAFIGARRLLPWLAGLLLTFLVWGWALVSAVGSRWDPEGAGAAVDLGLLMMVSAPSISLVVVAVHLATSARARRR